MAYHQLDGVVTAPIREGECVVKSSTSGQSWYLRNPFSYGLPLEKDDLIVAVVTLDATRPHHAVLAARPAVELSLTADSFRHCLYAAVLDKGRVTPLLRRLFEIHPSSDTLFEMVDKLADRLRIDDDVKKILEPLSRKQIAQLFRWWRRRRLGRALDLLGVDQNVRDLESDDGRPVRLRELYRRCRNEPHRVYSLPLARASEIAASYGLSVSQDELQAAVVGRDVAHLFYQMKFSCFPLALAEQNIPHFLEVYPLLALDTDLEHLYLPDRLKVEQGVADLLRDLYDDPPPPYRVLTEQYPTEKPLTDEQTQAVQRALEEPLSVISGAAGTGKTTVIQTVAKIVLSYGRGVVLTGFTGHSVAHMRRLKIFNRAAPSTSSTDEVDGEDDESEKRKLRIMTIHMLLAKQTDFSGFDIVVVDEFSQVTTPLLYRLLRRIRKTAGRLIRLVFVGDVNQLEPIGWGSSMRQLMLSSKVMRTILTRNHRNARGILLNAERLLAGQPLIDCDEFKLSREDPLTVYTRLEAEGGDVRLLTPYVDDVEKLNAAVQALRWSKQPPPTALQDEKGRKWAVGDLVMMTANNYSYDCLNGDEGVVVRVDADKFQIEVDFAVPGEVVTPKLRLFGVRTGVQQVSTEDDDEDGEYIAGAPKKMAFTRSLVHAYVLTVHRCQGSEYARTIVYLNPQRCNRQFVTRNLLYTALTRGMRGVTACGRLGVLTSAEHDFAPLRLEQLARRLDV